MQAQPYELIQADHGRIGGPGRSDPKDPFESASKQFFDSLATEEKEIFKATTLAEQVLKEAQLADEASKDRTSRKFANKLKPFVAGIEQYGAALDIMSNTNSLILCPLWGGIRVILHLAREFGDYFGRITTMLEQIGYNLSRLKRYPRLYPNNTDLGQAMAHVYRHIFLFCEKAKVAFGEGKRKKNKSFDFTGLRVAMKLIWKPFKEQFEETQQSIAMYVDIIEKEVSIAEKEEAHKERIKAEAERQTQALRWEKTEENNKSLEEHHAKIDYFLDEQSIRKVYEWLSPADVEVNHAVASKLRHSHTGEWFLSGQEFKGWLTGDYKFLWLYAIPGAGKTILLSTIVNYLKENVKSHSDKVGLAYFYCDYKDVQKQCPTRTLGTLLAMLGAQNKGVFHELKTFFEKQRKENLSYTPSFDELRSQLLLVSTSRFFSQILIVIDALDECDDREFLMDALLELSNETSGCIKVLVTSRSEPDIHSIFSKMPNVCIRKDDVSADVESYITSEVKSRIQSKKLKLRDPNLEQEITTALAEKADGMFQWVKCQIYQLCTMKSDKTIRAALLKLPKTLEDTYVRILQRLEREYEEDIGNVQKILWWLVKGVRTLTLDELAEALSIDPDDEDSTAMDFDAVWTDPDDILVLCGSLVTVSPDRTKVALAHYSVKEFLVSSRVLEILPGFYMGGIEIEASIAKICLTYLCFEDFQDGPLSDSTELGQRLEKYHFLKYAAQSWATHFRRYGNGNDDKALFDLTLRLLRVESGNFTSWRQIYQSRGNFRQGTSRDFQPLYYASLFGLPGAVKALVASGIDSDIGGVENGKALRAAALEGHLEVVEILLESCDIQSNHGKGGNALYAAASRGHDKIVQLLLDRGAEIESHKGKHGTALLVAALEGHKSVVQLLLARGANTAVVNKRYGTPLSAAAEKGHESILRVLLQHGVDVNARGGWYGHPLVFAVVGNNEKIVQLLVDNGADVDAKGGKHQTGLITAATLGNLQIMKMLVGRGVEVNDFNDKTGDALYAAASAGHVEIVKFLLDSGADVNAKGGKNRNALNAACAEGHQEIVRQLLDCGAYANAIDEHCGGAVHIAALNGHPELVRMLVEAGADLNAEGGIHRTTLQAAGITGRADMVQLVIDLGVPSGDNDNMSAALVLAACNSHKDAIRLLVELGADINAFNLTKSNDYWSPLQVAAYEGDAEVVQLLLDLGADVNLKGGTHGTPLLAFLAGPVDPVDMPEVLLRAGADVSVGGGSEYGTPLAVAAHRGYVKGVRLFLENGADANQIRVRYKETENQKTTWYFETALQYAIESETEEAEEIVKLLIEGGADINLAICTDPTNGMGCADALQSAAGVGNERLVRKLVELGAKLEFDSSGPRCYYNSALQAAAATGNTDIMRVLIELGSDVNAPGGAVGTALAVAALEGQCDAITLLLDSGADVNACTTGRYGTALQAGAYCGETELVSLLVQRGADINQFAKGSHYGYALIAATFSEYTEIISLLIELGADVNVQNPHPSRYFTALHAAADTGNYENTTLLIKHGADVNACGGRSGTALTAAYGHAWYLLVDQLLDHGALSDLRGGYYGTAVCAGIQQSSDNLFYHMLRNGTIDPNIDCGRWGNPLATAVFFRDGQYLADKFLDLEEVDVNGRPGIYGTALHGACRNGRKELVERLLKRGADINACAGKYWTPVIAAVAGGDLELVKLLVEKGANIHTIGRSGTAIHFAASGKSLDIVTFLLDHGADINVKAGKYSTVLQVASLNGHRDIAQLLIEKGAEVNAKGGRFGTALAAASLAGHLEVVDLLLENGAEVNIIGGRYGNALQSAVINSREELAEMLVEKGAKPQADQGWWKNAPFSMRRNAEGLARRLLGIGGNEHTDSTKTAGTNDVRPADSDLSNSFL